MKLEVPINFGRHCVLMCSTSLVQVLLKSSENSLTAKRQQKQIKTNKQKNKQKRRKKLQSTENILKKPYTTGHLE